MTKLPWLANIALAMWLTTGTWATAGWLDRNIAASAGQGGAHGAFQTPIYRSLKENLGRLTDLFGTMVGTVAEGNATNAEDIWKEAERAPADIAEDSFPVIRAEAFTAAELENARNKLEAVMRKITRIAGMPGRYDPRAALAIAGDERELASILDYGPLNQVALKSRQERHTARLSYDGWIEISQTAAPVELKPRFSEDRANSQMEYQSAVAKLVEDANWSLVADGSARIADKAGHQADQEPIERNWDELAAESARLAERPKDERLSLEQRIRAQRALAVLGFDPGPADGVFGKRTRAAILKWQVAEGLEATGFLTLELVKALAEAVVSTGSGTGERAQPTSETNW